MLAANHILDPKYGYPKLTDLLNKKVLVVVGTATLLLGVPWLYGAWQLHERLLTDQAQEQKRLPMKLSNTTTWVGVTVGFTSWTYILNVTLADIELSVLEKQARRDICAGPKQTLVKDGASYSYEYRGRSGTAIGRFTIASCP